MLRYRIQRLPSLGGEAPIESQGPVRIDSLLRKVLFMATMGAMRHNSHLRAYYDRLRARGKLHKVALVATMRKLLLILNAIIKTDTPWSESCLINL
jgi:transposase